MTSSNISPEEVLRRYRVIAVVGCSKYPWKEAHSVPAYLKSHGYKIIPVNPTVSEILGERCYPTLMDIPPELASQIEVVEVFRPSKELPPVAKQTVEVKKRYGRPFVFWAQLGLENEEAKEILNTNDIRYVMNACMRTVHQQNF